MNKLNNVNVREEIDEVIGALVGVVGTEESIKEDKENEAKRIKLLVSEFVQLHDRACQAYDNHESALSACSEFAKSAVIKEGIVRYAKRCRYEDRKMLNEVKLLAQGVKNSSGTAIFQNIMKIFGQVFKNARSKSYDVGKISSGEHITVGPYGFGMRPSVQSKPVCTSSHHFNSFYKHKDEIVTLIEQEKTMKELAKKLKSFIEIVPDVNVIESGDMKIEFTHKVPVLFERERLDDRPVHVSKLVFGVDEIQLTYEGSYAYSDSDTISYSDSMDVKSAMLYVLIRPMLQEYIEKYRVKATPFIESASQLINKLQQRFGREILFSEV